MTEIKPEVLFYHLERQSLEEVLPSLLQKTLARRWKAVVQAGSRERMEALDLALWTYADDSFLPHGTSAAGFPELQPVYLTTGDDAPNGGRIRFMVDGAAVGAYEGFDRLVYLFDGRDTDAVSQARVAWKGAKAAGCSVTYWQQGDRGWEKKA